MIRQTGYIMLTTLLILTTVGFYISRHYCNDNLVSVSIDLPADSCCNDDGKECCHDDNLFIVLKVDFTQPVTDEISISELILFGTVNKELVTEYAKAYFPTSTIADPSPPLETHLFLAKLQSYLL